MSINPPVKAAVLALVAGALLSAPASAHRHADGGGSLEPTGMSEKRLRAFETAVLGPEHAAEHARERAALRSGRLRAQASSPAPARAAAAAAPDPAVEGRWVAHFPIPVIAINAIMLPSGRVLWFAYPRKPDPNDANAANYAQAWLWDPAKGSGGSAFKRVDPPTDPATGNAANIWCAGNALLPDGRVVVTGGNLAYATATTNYKGLNKVYTFNPWSEKWVEQPHMAHGRWYPSQVLMPNGEMAIMSGFDENGVSNKDVEIFRPDPNLDGSGGTVRKIGKRGGTNEPPDGGLYPHLFWMPSGRIFVAGPEKTDNWFLHSPVGQNWTTLVGHWDSVAAPQTRVWGTGVLLPQTAAGSHKVELIGGSDPQRDAMGKVLNATPKSSTETYTETGPNAWTAGAAMNVARSHLNTVQLPDLSMVSIGGGLGSKNGDQYAVSATGAERRVDLYSPSTNSWHLGAAQVEARAYHSTALLLPDATVVSAGDDFNGAPTSANPSGAGTGVDSDTAEVYEPPYLFNADGSRAARPTISSAPDWVHFGSPFEVGTPDGNISKAVLVAPGATTHANDMSQRVVPLALVKQAGGVKLTAPPAPNNSADVALPGYYMLFLLNDKGVPSVARWISLAWNTVPKRTPPVWPLPPSPQLATGLLPALGTSTSPAKAKDSTGPSILFSRSGLNARRGAISGQVSDASGVRSVSAALGRPGRRCRWWSRRRKRLSRPASCKRPAWIAARLVRKGTKITWTVALHHRVPRGRYVVALRAVDARGNTTSRTAGAAVKVSVR